MKRSLFIAIALAALSAPSIAAAQAAPAELVQVRQDRSQRMSLGEVVRRLRATRQGEMLDAREDVRGGRAIYVVIWEYPGGRVGNIYVDQRTGAVLGED